MPKREIVEIAYQVDLSDIVAAHARKAGLSEKETKNLMIQLKKRETAATRAIKKIESRQHRASILETRAVKKATKDKIEAFRKFGDAAQGSIGSITTRVFNLGEGLIQFGSAAGPVGIAGVALAALGTGGVLAISAVVGAMAGLVLKADEMNEEIREFNNLGGFKDAVSPEQLLMIQKFNHQMEAIKISMKQTAVVLAAEFAPQLAVLGDLMLRVALLGRDATVKLAGGFDLVKEAVIQSVKGLLYALTAPISAIKLLGDAFVAVARATGKSGPLIEQLGKGLEQIDSTLDGLIRKPVDIWFGVAGAAANKAAGSLSKYDDEVNAILGKLKTAKVDEATQALLKQMQAIVENARATKRKAKADKEVTVELADMQKVLLDTANATGSLMNAFSTFSDKAAAGVASPIGKINAELNKNLAHFETARNELQAHADKLSFAVEVATDEGLDPGLLQSQLDNALDNLSEYERARVQLVQAASEKVQAIRDKEADAHETAVIQTVNAVMMAGKHLGAFASQLADNAKEGTDAQKKAARAAFAINQALAVSSITMSTAQAVMQALGSMPPPMSFVAAGAAGVAGAAQLATVVATPPPSFHIGGGIGTSTTAPDEVMVKAKSGEGVLTGAGMRAIGGRQGLADANRGGSGGREMVVVQKYQHRPLAVVMEDSVRMTNSPIRRAIKGKKKVGHRG